MTTNNERFDTLREMLLTRKQEIQKQIDALLLQHRTEQQELREASVADTEDRSFQNSTSERQIFLMEGWNQMRHNIDTALDRLNDGTYGFCEDCDEPIKQERLKAQPFARRCLICQEQAELFEKIGKEHDYAGF